MHKLHVRLLQASLFTFATSPFISASESGAGVPVVEADFETDPIPMGESDADDPAIWFRAADPAQSLILATSKYDDDEGNLGGLGVYDLQGNELKFIQVGKLNNVDIVYQLPINHDLSDLAIASNRSISALSLFQLDSMGDVQFIDSLSLEKAGINVEPYGICSRKTEENVEVFLPVKSGEVFAVQLAFDPKPFIQSWRKISLKSFVTSEQEQRIIRNVELELEADGELDELDEALEERFILEACVVDQDQQRLLVGMEKLGVWMIDLADETSPAQLLWEVTGSFTEAKELHQNTSGFVLADDVEGISIYRSGLDDGYYVVSSQGINEYLLFDRRSFAYKGSFQVQFGKQDPVTQTDGLAVSSANFGPQFPAGLMVVHDDENTDESGQVLNGNFKIINWLSIEDALKLRD